MRTPSAFGAPSRVLLVLSVAGASLAGGCALPPLEAAPPIARAPAEPEPKRWMVGTEVDLVPFLLDGYYGSVIAGYDHWRARYVVTNATTPDFVTRSGYSDNEIDVDAFIVDYYFDEGFRGWWLGPGYESWDGAVTQDSSGLRQSYRTDILTLGGGYTIRFSDHLYLNPWAAVHIPIGGDTEVRFPTGTFDIDVTAEVSIKLGLNF